MKEILVNLVKVFVVEGALWLARFVKKHPWLSLAVIVFFLILPWIYQQYQWASGLMKSIDRFRKWIRGENEDGTIANFTTRAFRWLTLFSLTLIFPFLAPLVWLAFLSHWIARERIQAQTVTGEQIPTTPDNGGSAEAGWS